MEWNSETIENIQGCLDCTDWGVFRTATDSIDEYTEAVTSYIDFCGNCCVPSHVRVSFNNDKAFFSPKLRCWQKEEAFKSGYTDRYKESRYSFKRAVREAKRLYAVKLQHQFSANEAVSVWDTDRSPTTNLPYPTL